MKTLLAIWFSLALLGAQSFLFLPAVARPVVSQCDCGNCAKLSCCKKKCAPDSPPATPAPVRTSGQTEWQVLAAVLGELVSPPVSSATEFSFRFLPPIPAAAIPLYQRNCSFLI